MLDWIKGAMEIMKLFMTPDEKLENVKMTEIFDDAVFDTDFWLYWRTMFAFKDDQSALEMKCYIHHIGGLPDFTALRFTKYNQYEAMVLPMVKYLQERGVRFHYNTKVTNVLFDIQSDKKLAKSIVYACNGKTESIDLTENDLVFYINGSNVENSTYGSQTKASGMARSSANTVPIMMPFASAYFQPREAGDRPNVVPAGSVNFAFIGNFAETPRDTVFTTEYSIRTAMEAVYTLLNVDRGVPEVWGSVYDVRDLLNSTVQLRDGKPVTEMKLSFIQKILENGLLRKIEGTEIEKLLKTRRKQELIAGRKIELLLPEGYEHTQAVYPTVWLLDGDTIFQTLDQIPENQKNYNFILAGIPSSDRLSEYTPWPASALSRRFPDFGEQGEEHLSFLQNQIMGYSLGGLLSIYSLFVTDAFGCVSSMSGSFWYSEWTQFIERAPLVNQSADVYISSGINEGGRAHDIKKNAADGTKTTFEFLEKALPDNKVHLEWNEYGHHDHISVKLEAAFSYLDQL